MYSDSDGGIAPAARHTGGSYSLSGRAPRSGRKADVSSLENAASKIASQAFIQSCYTMTSRLDPNSRIAAKKPVASDFQSTDFHILFLIECGDGFIPGNDTKSRLSLNICVDYVILNIPFFWQHDHNPSNGYSEMK